MAGGTAEYVRISQQPTTLESGDLAAVTEFESAVTRQGFAVTRTASGRRGGGRGSRGSGPAPVSQPA